MHMKGKIFYMKIESDEVRRGILEARPIFMFGRIFIIKSQSPEVETLRGNIDRVPIFSKLWDLPNELWGENEEGLNFAASHMGDPQMIDESTKCRKYMDYAKVCVITTTDQEIKTEIEVDVGRSTIFKVEYEWIPVRCETCKVFGHGTNSCHRPKGDKQTIEGSINLEGSNNLGPKPQPGEALQPSQDDKEVSNSHDFIFGGRIDNAWQIVPLRVKDSVSSSGQSVTNLC